MISITAQQICAFVYACAKIRFSHAAAHTAIDSLSFLIVYSIKMIFFTYESDFAKDTFSHDAMKFNA